jgi:hypothetical protein
VAQCILRDWMRSLKNTLKWQIVCLKGQLENIQIFLTLKKQSVVIAFDKFNVKSLITEHLPIFSHSLTKLSDFPYWTGKLENYRCSLSIKRKRSNPWRGWVIVLLQFFLGKKKALDVSLVPASYLPHFLVCFEWLKTWWVSQLELYKTSLYFKGKDGNNPRF